MEDMLICPLCGEEQRTHEPDGFSSLMCNTECEQCGKTFWYSVSVTREYSPWADDSTEDVYEETD